MEFTRSSDSIPRAYSDGFWNDLCAVLSNAKYESNRSMDLSQHSNSPVCEAAQQKYISLKYNADQK